MRYERLNLLSRIEEGFGKKPITLLLGPRQCGKTTLARHYAGRPDTHWFDLEDYLHEAAWKIIRWAHSGLCVVPPFFANVAKRVRKAPKLYLRDTGLLHALMGIETVEQLQTSGRMGFSWESFCLEHLIHEAGLAGEDCFHYSVQSGAEMDLVTTVGGAVFGFEFKHNDVPVMTKSMRTAADDLGAKRVFVLYPGLDTFEMDSSGRFVALAWRDLAQFRSRFA
jgi:predicted AAA+ superfamily ATPase